ncbi:MAG: hypothetical protein WC375_09425 [Methanomassiliicoccales archaeon]
MSKDEFEDRLTRNQFSIDFDIFELMYVNQLHDLVQHAKQCKSFVGFTSTNNPRYFGCEVQCLCGCGFHRRIENWALASTVFGYSLNDILEYINVNYQHGLLKDDDLCIINSSLEVHNPIMALELNDED